MRLEAQEKIYRIQESIFKMSVNKLWEIKGGHMQIQLQKCNPEFKRSVCIGLGLFLFVVLGAGCATSPPPDQGSHIKIQSGQSSAEVSWPK